MISQIEFLTKQLVKRTWGTEEIFTNTHKYLGKINTYLPGKAGGLQYHVDKDETFYIISGIGYLDTDLGDGDIVRRSIGAGDILHIPIGAVHRIEAISTLVGIEVSTYHINDRVRCEEQYGVPVIGENYGLETTR